MTMSDIESVRVPVFGDIHGNLEGMINTIKYLERTHKERYRFALQTGDFGYYGSEQSFRAETKGRRNLEFENGVLNYLYDNDTQQRYFGKDGLDCKIIFIRGNHEDQESLRSLTKNKGNDVGCVEIDKEGRILYLPDGRVLDLTLSSGRYLRIAAYGGVAADHRPKAFNRNSLIAFDPGAVELLSRFGSVDVLLTHQGPEEGPKGSSVITALLERPRSKLHLHGHSHKHHANKDICVTKSFSLGDMPKSKRPFTLSHDFYGFICVRGTSVDFQLD